MYKEASDLADGLIADYTIIIDFMSLVGIPCVKQVLVQNKRTSRFWLTFLYALASLLLFTKVAQSFYRFSRIDSYETNVLAVLNKTAFASTQYLLKLFLILKIKKLRTVLVSFTGFMERYRLESYKSVKKSIAASCIAILLVPIPMSIYSVLVEEKYYDQKCGWFCCSCPIPSWLMKPLSLLFQYLNGTNEISFPVLCTVLLSYMYFTFSRILLRAFTEQLVSSQRCASCSIKRCVDMYADIRKIWTQVEDVASVNALFLYGMSLSSFLHVVTRYPANRQYISILARMKIASAVAQILLLCVSGSTVTDKWNEARLLVQELARYHGNQQREVPNKDVLLLMSLIDGTRMDLSFSCLGMLSLNNKLLLTTFGSLITIGTLMH